MEGKESTVSGSLGGNSEFNSLPSLENGGAVGGGVVPVTMNMGVSINMENNAGVTSSALVAVGSGAISAGGGGSELMTVKKKRGRPRKYDSNGNITPGYVKSPPAAAQMPSQPCFTLSTPPSFGTTAGAKRGRGRPSGSGSRKTPASLGESSAEGAGGDFTPHVVTAYTGEDVAGKILTFAQRGSRGVCVLSANGCVSNVTIRQPDACGGLITYEGRFEILSLMGSYTISEEDGLRSRSGGLSVTLASSDGRIIGGGVAGLLMAASPVQIVVGSFEANVSKRKHNRPTSSPVTPTPPIPISQPLLQPHPADSWNHHNISIPLLHH